MPENYDGAGTADTGRSHVALMREAELLRQELGRQRGLLASEREEAFRRHLAQAEDIGALSNQLRSERGKVKQLEAEVAGLRADLDAARMVLAHREEEVSALAMRLFEQSETADEEARVLAAQERVARESRQTLLELELEQLGTQLAWLEREAGPARLDELREQHVGILASVRRPEPVNALPATLGADELDTYLVLARSALFDRAWYERSYPGAVANGLDAVLDYMRLGWRDGRDPGPAFGSDDYLIANPDVTATGINPLVHYLHYGRYEGRRTAASATVQTTYPSDAPQVVASAIQQPVRWFFAGDTLDWLRHHSHLTGVGRVTSELLFAAVTDDEWPAMPCKLGQSLTGFVGFDDPAELEELAERMNLSSAESLRLKRCSTGAHSGPRSGDHIVFTGVVWTENYERLFRHLRRIGVTFSVLIHDIIPLTQPEFVGPAYSAGFARWLATVLRLAETVFVSTAKVAQQLRGWSVAARISGTAEVRTIAFGIRLPARTAPVMVKAVADRRYVLSVGTIDSRKNQILLLRLWLVLLDQIGAERLPLLVLVGRDDLGIAANPEFAPLIANDRLVVLTSISDEQLAALYLNCLFTAFPSLSEGYGLPVAESLTYGKLCLSSDLAEVRAHAGELPWYFDPHDFDSAVNLFRAAILDTSARTAANAEIVAGYAAKNWRQCWADMQGEGSLEQSRMALGVVDATAFAGTVTLSPAEIVAMAERWCTHDAPLVSILIINWNSAPLTLDCIRQIWAHTSEVRYEIIIADNGSSDEQRQTLRGLGPGVRLIELGCNRYFGEANNIAAEEAQGQFVCFLNNDAFVESGWLPALLDPFATDPSIGGTGPLFIYPDGVVQEAGAVVNQQGYPVRFARSETVVPREFDCRRYVDYISAAALVVDRALFMAIGGFDMAFEPAYYEDTDLCFKLASQGRRVLFCPDVQIIHIEGSSANGDILAEQRRARLGDLNRAKFVSRWGRYLRDRDQLTLQQIGRAVVPAQIQETPPFVVGRPRALIMTPYNLTPGGGERYLLTLATALTDSHDVILATLFPYSRLRLHAIGTELGLDVSRLHLRHWDQIGQEAPFDVQITMGNQICPDIDGRASLNIYHCQFPFPQPHAPTKEEIARLESYDALLVNSDYTSLHSQAALVGSQLAERPIYVLHPPVGLLAPGKKEPHRILSVGRFFTGGHTKRQDLLIAAFKTLCERVDGSLELHLAGSSTPNHDAMQYLSDLMASAEGYPIHFHVNCPPPALRDLYASSAIYWHGTGLGVDLVAAPFAAEHFGIAIVEAMSAGAVPFALASGGIREVIRSGENGFLYRSQEELVAQTFAFLSADAQAQTAVRDSAVRRAQDFAASHFAGRFIDLVQQLRAKRR